MCGIVGVVGKGAAAPLLLEGLRRLEYRGYDSAGVATLAAEDGRIERRRAEGKLGNLAAALERAPLAGATGIGHTRWATHGAPTERNAHPHATRRVAVVHNGIIENHAELRAELEAEGAEFETETDTETFVRLVDRGLARGDGLGQLGDPPGLAAGVQRAAGPGDQPGAVVAAVLQPLQPVQQQRRHFRLADNPDDAAHQLAPFFLPLKPRPGFTA